MEPLLAQTFQDSDTIGKVVLHVPLAHTWRNGMWITDDQGTRHKFQILKVDHAGFQTPSDPAFWVVIGNEHGQVVAAVQRKMKLIGTTDSYIIYTTKPNWRGQHPEHRVSQASNQACFPVGCVVQRPLGGTYTVKSCKNGQVLMKAKNGCIPWSTVCCTGCLVVGCFQWNLEFHAPHELAPLVTRDQTAGLVAVDAGTSPLLGLCVAFAVDHMTRPTC